MEDFPPLVQRAIAVARDLSFPLTREEAGPGATPSASLPGTGRFLAMLAAGCTGGRIGELGTGVGIGAAWMASAMPADCSLVTVEFHERRAAAARHLFTGDPRITVITGQAGLVIDSYAPFDLLFSDCGSYDSTLIELLRVGGRVVMDDVTPAGGDFGQRIERDIKREFFRDPRLVSVEVVFPDLRNSLLAGTRVS
jgi:predicted O-methyltransferase YrrM